jgi:hypothetical protein
MIANWKSLVVPLIGLVDFVRRGPRNDAEPRRSRSRYWPSLPVVGRSRAGAWLISATPIPRQISRYWPVKFTF